MKNVIIVSLGVLMFIGIEALSFLLTAGMVWLGCCALGLLGIYAIELKLKKGLTNQPQYDIIKIQ